MITPINAYGDTHPSDTGTAVFVQSDDNILVGGEATKEDYSNSMTALVRYCADGALDNGSNCGAGGFGASGIETFQPAGGTSATIRRMVYQSSTKMLVAVGTMKVPTKSNVLAARFDLGLGGSSVSITGNAGIGGASLSYDNGGAQVATADASGDYSFDVPSGWSGTVTPSKSNYTFTPADRTYNSITVDQTDQDYSVATCTAPGTGTVNWSDAFGTCPAGAKYIIPDGLTVVLDTNIAISSDLEVQSGGALNPNGKTVTLTGSTAQTLSGDPLTFYNLVVAKTNKTDTVTISGKLRVTKKLTITRGKFVSASDYGDIEIDEDGELELTSDITVSGHFTNTGTLTTGGFGVTFDGGTVQNLMANVFTSFDDLTVSAGTTLVDSVSDDNVLVSGILTNDGVMRKTQAVGSVTQYYFGLAGKFNGTDMEIDITDLAGGDPLTSIQVDQVAGDHAGRTGSAGTGAGWGHYWTLTAVGSHFVADITLPHDVNPAADAKACRFVSGTSWDCRQDAYETDSVTYADTNQFSDWAVGNQVGPTAVTFGSLRAAESVAVPGVLAALAGVVLGVGSAWRRRSK